MALNYATSFNPVNYSGPLFNRGNERTPLLSLLGGRRYTVNHVKFTTGQEYTTGEGAQPNISEEASLVAPDWNPIEREQMTNVTQIFQYSVGVSDAKRSNMGTLHGLNVGGQTANPPTELDFQTRAVLVKASRDMEFTITQGVFNEATTDATVNKTRGFTTAITTNVLDTATDFGGTFGYWAAVEAMRLIDSQHSSTANLYVVAKLNHLLQLQADALASGLTVIPGDRSVTGINVTQIITPLGNLNLVRSYDLPDGEALMLNLDNAALVEQPVPGKGNFYLEQLAKVGAGDRYQIFGQLGLDHGPEWTHAKFTNLSDDFTPPTTGGGANP